MQKKTGILTPEQENKYNIINKSTEKQRANYEDFIKSEPLEKYKNDCENLGLSLDVQTGRIRYLPDKKNILSLKYDLCYVRHGKTEGNTEPRVFQGYVDYPENQLTDLGIEQAQQAAYKMQKDHPNWIPDLIVFSPLQRAIDTGKFYTEKNPDIPTIIVEDMREMQFGSWDNQKVIEVHHTDMAHLFYLEQNVLVKAPNPHIVQKNWNENKKSKGTEIPSENFLNVLQRVRKALIKLEDHPILKNIIDQKRKPKVLIYGHSMAGAAIMIVLGIGKKVENSEYLGFDGKYIMPNATPTML